MTATTALAALQLRRLARRRWLQVALSAGLAAAVVVALVAAADEGLAREDALRRGAASVLLLGGLALAVLLGSAAINRDGDAGHLGMLAGAGATRPQLVTAAVGARVVALLAVVAAWAVVVQAGSLALGMGLDGPLAVHTLAVAEGLLLAMIACAAASAVVGPVAAGAFGVAVYVLAQAAVNLKTAADQNLIGTADTLVTALYHVAPRTVTSPMIAEMQLRDVAGPAAPRVEINENPVFVPAAEWDTVVWTLAWCLLLGILCAAGLRRRPLV
ncbi:hypothetical protein [Miltoncostaea marina]|uniref:hypothetical protein n=1 Tax=Miltoncostaea marina TaxID=2843215 RepID=UPI001C3C93DF|nr:hypothetical protein [Miltoncostaea marina]